jgi:hypothetical protein
MTKKKKLRDCFFQQKRKKNPYIRRRFFFLRHVYDPLNTHYIYYLSLWPLREFIFITVAVCDHARRQLTRNAAFPRRLNIRFAQRKPKNNKKKEEESTPHSIENCIPRCVIIREKTVCEMMKEERSRKKSSENLLCMLARTKYINWVFLLFFSSYV